MEKLTAGAFLGMGKPQMPRKGCLKSVLLGFGSCVERGIFNFVGTNLGLVFYFKIIS